MIRSSAEAVVNRHTLVLTQDDVGGVLRICGRDRVMDLMIARLQEALPLAYRSGAGTPARDGFRRCPGESGVLEWMPHHEAGRSITIKTVAYTPTNPEAVGLPTILGTITRFDDVTGHLTAICDGVLPTAIRTGAASAVASRLLARPNSAVVGLVGAGAQAVTQLHGLSRVFDIRRVLVHDVLPEHSRSFAERVAFLGLDVRVADLAELESTADIICTATSVGVDAGPVLTGAGLRPHVHVNAVGADLPGKVELPLALLRSAFVVPDHLGQARREGECQQLAAAEIGPELPALLADPAAVAGRADGRTVFDSTGFALEDHVALDVFLELAVEHGLGRQLRLEHLPVDALNPYAVDVLAGAAVG
ncbi:ornithine cyclodeaminase family protein [Micromonospora sp. NPDC000089]|uniref:ornithine cyclodeaminase family protein n=1 Tax=unclassified Micromonospora TaxID=2617518 RepID=UPI0036A0154B